MREFGMSGSARGRSGFQRLAVPTATSASTRGPLRREEPVVPPPCPRERAEYDNAPILFRASAS
jgi:hypothetical protein